jgi:cholesterol transport system auxiliary component
MRRRLLLPLLGAAPAGMLLSACGLGSAPRRDFYLLRDAGTTAAASPGQRIDQVLLVSAMALPGLYDGDRMIFSADGRSRSTFQFGYWSERPAQALQTLALARLAHAGHFRDVVSSTSGVRGELLLSLRLDELYLDTSQQPDRVSLAVAAELIDWRERRLLGRQAFQQTQAVQQDGATGLADAASEAMGRLLGELVDWTIARSPATAG